MNQDHELYKYIASLNKIRKELKVYKEDHVERWCDNNFYAFTRGMTLIATTNDDSQTQTRKINYHPYKPKDKLCNLLYEGDCLTVTDDNLVIVSLLNGESKIFVKSNSEEESEFL